MGNAASTPLTIDSFRASGANAIAATAVAPCVMMSMQMAFGKAADQAASNSDTATAKVLRLLYEAVTLKLVPFNRNIPFALSSWQRRSC